MFSAFWKLLRAIGYGLTGKIDKMREVYSANPHVIAAQFDAVVTQKIKQLNDYKSAVAGMITSEEKKKITLKTLTDEINRLEKLKAGALAKAKQIASKYADNPEGAKADPEYLKCQGAYKDFSSTLEEKKTRYAELETDITALSQNIGTHRTRIESLLRDLEKVKNEKHETIAEVISANEEKKIADMFSGISEDKTAKDLQEMRDLRTKAKAEARTSRELAGMDSKKSEDEFLEYATKSDADDEFDRLIGLTKEAPEVPVATTPTKISEN